jgi:hypothetical protein
VKIVVAFPPGGGNDFIGTETSMTNSESSILGTWKRRMMAMVAAKGREPGLKVEEQAELLRTLLAYRHRHLQALGQPVHLRGVGSFYIIERESGSRPANRLIFLASRDLARLMLLVWRVHPALKGGKKHENQDTCGRVFLAGIWRGCADR